MYKNLLDNYSEDSKNLVPIRLTDVNRENNSIQISSDGYEIRRSSSASDTSGIVFLPNPISFEEKIIIHIKNIENSGEDQYDDDKDLDKIYQLVDNTLNGIQLTGLIIGFTSLHPSKIQFLPSLNSTTDDDPYYLRVTNVLDHFRSIKHEGNKITLIIQQNGDVQVQVNNEVQSRTIMNIRKPFTLWGFLQIFDTQQLIRIYRLLDSSRRFNDASKIFGFPIEDAETMETIMNSSNKPTAIDHRQCNGCGKFTNNVFEIDFETNVCYVCYNQQIQEADRYFKNRSYTDGPSTSRGPPKNENKLADQSLNSINAMNQLCIICFDEKRTHALLPCGHLCLCNTCSLSERKFCPICTCFISDTLRIFK